MRRKLFKAFRFLAASHFWVRPASTGSQSRFRFSGLSKLITSIFIFCRILLYQCALDPFSFLVQSDQGACTVFWASHYSFHSGIVIEASINIFAFSPLRTLLQQYSLARIVYWLMKLHKIIFYCPTPTWDAMMSPFVKTPNINVW